LQQGQPGGQSGQQLHAALAANAVAGTAMARNMYIKSFFIVASLPVLGGSTPECDTKK